MNKNKLQFNFVTVLLLVVLLSGCMTMASSNRDPFYRDNGGWDSVRIPLIKPYYAILIKGDRNWQIPLFANVSSKDIYYYITLHHVEKIAVESSILMVYTPYIENVDASIGQKVLHWFVFVPDKNLETGFDNEADFLKYIQNYDVQVPAWEFPDSIYKQFIKTGCLDWIPDCK